MIASRVVSNIEENSSDLVTNDESRPLIENRRIESNPNQSNRKMADKLSLRTKIGYSFGHVINDLTGSYWFSYSLLIFKLRLPGNLAGSLILLGKSSS